MGVTGLLLQWSRGNLFIGAAIHYASTVEIVRVRDPVVKMRPCCHSLGSTDPRESRTSLGVPFTECQQSRNPKKASDQTDTSLGFETARTQSLFKYRLQNRNRP